MEIEVYTDGSATTADKPGGYAFVIVDKSADREIKRAGGYISSSTNNVAEITAAIEGLSEWLRLKDTLYPNDDAASKQIKVTLVSDSQLVLKYATGEYKCHKFHLVPLYIKLRDLYKQTGATTRWVKGHSGDKYNEICDKLAKSSRQSNGDV